jgi:DNA-binding transcriptional MerR regulator
MGGKATKLSATQSWKMLVAASITRSPVAQSWSFVSDFPSQAARSVAYTSLEQCFHFCSVTQSMATQLSQKRAFETPVIPDRLYFKIGDVANICGLETYVLRFWESQFPQLKPNKSGTGQRLYRRREVELVLEIKRLVHAEGYTLSGARHVLEQANRRSAQKESKPEAQPNSPSRLTPVAVVSNSRSDAVAATIGHARAELREIAALLGSSAPRPMRRRPRLTALLNPSDSLFPS